MWEIRAIDIKIRCASMLEQRKKTSYWSDKSSMDKGSFFLTVEQANALDSTGFHVDEEPDQILIDEKIDSERLIAITCLQSPRVVCQDDNGANAVFIAHARDDVPGLISEIRRLNKLLTEQ